MTAEEIQQLAEPEPAPASEPAPAVPDYLASPNAVFDDEGVQWRYGRAPDYSKTRKVWEEGKSPNPRVLGVPNSTCNVVDAWSFLCYHIHTADHVGIDHASSEGSWRYNAIDAS